MPPHTYGDMFLKFLTVNSLPMTGFAHSRKRIQGDLSNVCGSYVLYYVLMKSIGVSLCDIESMFGNDVYANDHFVVKYVRSVFKSV